ncbi:hypothetical protein [Sorangium sp. So ce394]|uniref:hypothetical protein n=1 Tax=Sorangium sp. So ce394 TaxID=3133310 RepID=UPI003F5C9AB3
MGNGLKGKACALVLRGCACALVVVPAPATAFELSGGVTVGGIQIGADPRLAVCFDVEFVGDAKRGL